MSNANAAAEVLESLLSVSILLFFCQSVGCRAPPETPHPSVPVPPRGYNTPVSVSSITFAGFCVSQRLSAFQKHLQHKDHIVPHNQVLEWLSDSPPQTDGLQTDQSNILYFL